MTKIELIKKLKELGYADFYSLDGSLDPAAVFYITIIRNGSISISMNEATGIL